MIRALKGLRTSTTKEWVAIANGFVMTESDRLQRLIEPISKKRLSALGCVADLR
jgi:hypothetical protein